MSPLILGLVLAAAILHAVWNLWAKELSEAGRSASLMWLMTACSAAIYAPPAAYLAITQGWRPQPVDFVFIAASGVIHVGYFFLLMRGYRASDLSLVYPVARGTGPLLTAIGAFTLFGDPPTAAAIAGALAIALGIAILAVRPQVLTDPRAGAGVRWGLATGGSIALYTLWDAWAVQRAHIPPLFFYAAGELVRVIVLAPWAWRDREGVARLWRDHRWRIVGIAAFSPLSYILVLIAMQWGAVSRIAPARELSILIGAYLGGRVLGEGDRHRRRLAAAVFVAGVVALAFSR